jgi:hypothetical protein
VDGSAEIQIRGDTADLRDLSGRQPQWQRFDCTGPVPANANLRLTANGRGRTELVGTPRNGGPAVVRIQDPEGGAQVYQFELSWNGGGQGDNRGYQGDNRAYQGGPPPATDRRDTDRDRRDGDRRDGQPRGQFTSDQAVQVCRDAIRQQARERFGTPDVNFRRINIDDEPGRNDWVVGMLEVRRGGREDHMRFSCSVNFDTGRVRSAQIDMPGAGSASRDIVAREMDTCRNAVSNRIGSRVDFDRMSVEDRNGPDVVTGTARTRGRRYEFSCYVSPYSGNVRNLEVRER